MYLDHNTGLPLLVWHRKAGNTFHVEHATVSAHVGAAEQDSQGRWHSSFLEEVVPECDEDTMDEALQKLFTSWQENYSTEAIKKRFSITLPNRGQVKFIHATPTSIVGIARVAASGKPFRSNWTHSDELTTADVDEKGNRDTQYDLVPLMPQQALQAQAVRHATQDSGLGMGR